MTEHRYKTLYSFLDLVNNVTTGVPRWHCCTEASKVLFLVRNPVRMLGLLCTVSFGGENKLCGQQVNVLSALGSDQCPFLKQSCY